MSKPLAGYLRNARLAVRHLGRGFAFVAVASKLLIPVGYMPDAIADGLPFTLCDPRVSSTLAATARSGPEIAGAERHAHAVASSGRTAPARQDLRHDETAAGSHGAAEHSGWDGCALGGLAQLAALGGGWHFVLSRSRPVSAAVPAPAIVDQSSAAGFRSRAPPAFAHS